MNNGALWDHSRHWLNIRPIYAFGEWVLDSMPLFDKEKGLGLDSIDVLEIVVNIEKTFGVQIPDRETGEKVLQSVNTIVDHLKASGAKT